VPIVKPVSVSVAVGGIIDAHLSTEQFGIIPPSPSMSTKKWCWKVSPLDVVTRRVSPCVMVIVGFAGVLFHPVK
jgi:hypothetical protein